MAGYADALGELAAELERLWSAEPDRDLDQFAEATGLQPKTIRELRSGSELLSWEVTCAYVTACGADKDRFRTLWEKVDGLQEGSEETHLWRTRGTNHRIGTWERRNTSGQLPAPTAGEPRELAGQLQLLRSWAGGPSLKEIERRTHGRLNDTTLSQIYNRRPDLLTAERAEHFAAACGLPPWEAVRWREAAAEFNRVPGVRVDPPMPPVPPPPAPTNRFRPRHWRELALAIAAVAFMLLYLQRLFVSPAERYEVQVASPDIPIDPAHPVVVPLVLPTVQDWYLDLWMDLIPPNAGLGTCRQNAELTYYVVRPDQTRLSQPGKVAPAANRKDHPVNRIHLGRMGGSVSLQISVKTDEECELTLRLTGTTVHN
jgi:hypothetical protein